MKIDKPAREMKSPIIDKILAEMDAQPWHVKFRRWLKFKYWVFMAFVTWHLYRKQKHKKGLEDED